MPSFVVEHSMRVVGALGDAIASMTRQSGEDWDATQGYGLDAVAGRVSGPALWGVTPVAPGFSRRGLGAERVNAAPRSTP